MRIKLTAAYLLLSGCSLGYYHHTNPTTGENITAFGNAIGGKPAIEGFEMDSSPQNKHLSINKLENDRDKSLKTIMDAIIAGLKAAPK